MSMTPISSRMNSVWDRWCEHADQAPDSVAIVHWRADSPSRHWTWGELVHSAQFFAAALTDSGISKGDVCAIIARHNPLLYPVYMGCVCAGAIPAILAYPNPRLHPEKFREGLQGMGQRWGSTGFSPRAHSKGSFSHSWGPARSKG